MSFTAIQLSQQEQGTAPVKDKRSLVEIQEEERSRQVEEDFLRWWAAEEARLQAEEQASRQPPRFQKTKKPKNEKGKPSVSGTTELPPSDVHTKKTKKSHNRKERDGNRSEQP
ncbi:uncharacterized protein FIBRA_07825 [Fibroporia radiculosa]|uniref:Uncharacterized protein n=1 Tax=Fibroporia radiculosa TaxID=599839 RepID=J4I1G3_9APHY|nr:uncharacterized protein FIBRA_07825 [Fibroporia radiculosa]CCM05597.1 predicted protein [Fibroporia radiculosa]